MSKIAKLYIPLIRDFNIMDLQHFTVKFYEEVTEKDFHDVLRAYQIVPEQHQIKYVMEALKEIANNA